VHVRLPDGGELLGRQVEQGAACQPAGSGHQAIEPPPPVQRRPDRGREHVRVGGVARQGDDLGPGGGATQRYGRGLGSLGVSAEDDDRPTALDDGLGDAQTDPTGAAGDQDRAATGGRCHETG